MAKNDERNRRRRERYNFFTKVLGWSSKEAKAPLKTIKEKPEKAPTLSGIVSEYITDPIRKVLNTLDSAITGQPSNTKPKRQTKQTRASPKDAAESFANWLKAKGYTPDNKPGNASLTKMYRNETGNSIGNDTAAEVIRKTLDIPFDRSKVTKFTYHHPTDNKFNKKYLSTRGSEKQRFLYIISYWVKDSNGNLSQKTVTVGLPYADPDEAMVQVIRMHDKIGENKYHTEEVYDAPKHRMRILYAVDMEMGK